MSKHRKVSEPEDREGIKFKRLEELDNIDVGQFDADTELWESGKLGASGKHAKPVSDEEEQVLDDALGLRLLSFRIQKPLIEKLKALAQLEGIGYQPLMRQILTRYVRENEHTLESLATLKQEEEKAEQLFTQALQYKEMIPTLKPMSGERIGAEHDYSNSLRKANSLFNQVYKKSSDPVLKKHVTLRLNQIAQLCGEQSPTTQGKKYRKAV